MNRRLAIAAAPVALTSIALVAAGCGGGSGGGASSSPYATGGGATTAKTANAPALRTTRTALGTVLVDAQGRTVYLFEKDKGMASSCAGACASIWPPVAKVGKIAPGSPLSAAKLGTIKRADGKTEATYGGHPLYTYAGDAKPGDVKGQGLDQFGAHWYVLAPSGQKVDED